MTGDLSKARSTTSSRLPDTPSGWLAALYSPNHYLLILLVSGFFRRYFVQALSHQLDGPGNELRASHTNPVKLLPVCSCQYPESNLS